MTDDLFLSTAVIVLVSGLILLSAILWAIPLRLWVEAISAGARVSIGYLVGMRLRKVVPPDVVRPLIWATKAGILLDVGDLEAHYLAGGAVDRVVRARISADKANIDLSFKQAAAIDLAGRDVQEAVGTSVNPKVIDVPSGQMARSPLTRVPAECPGPGCTASPAGLSTTSRSRS